MSLHTFADFVDAMGPVKTWRFGETSHNQVQVLSPDVFLLRQQNKEPDTELLTDATKRIELSNIKSVQLKTFTFETVDWTNHIVYIFFKNQMMLEAYIRGRGIVREPFDNVMIYAPSSGHAQHIKTLLDELCGLTDSA